MIAKYVSSFDFNSNRFLYLESLPYIFIICSLAVLFRTIKRNALGEKKLLAKADKTRYNSPYEQKHKSPPCDNSGL